MQPALLEHGEHCVLYARSREMQGDSPITSYPREKPSSNTRDRHNPGGTSRRGPTDSLSYRTVYRCHYPLLASPSPRNFLKIHSDTLFYTRSSQFPYSRVRDSPDILSLQGCASEELSSQDASLLSPRDLISHLEFYCEYFLFPHPDTQNQAVAIY